MTLPEPVGREGRPQLIPRALPPVDTLRPRELRPARPPVLRRRPQHAEDQLQLIDLRLTLKRDQHVRPAGAKQEVSGAFVVVGVGLDVLASCCLPTAMACS